jgi:tryptophanyl-tRNA synthetase
MRIFSGIQPTGRKHLGNFLGAIRHYVAGLDRGDPIYCIVDLHAITVPYDPTELAANVLDTTALLIAAGLDPGRCILFRQSDVHEHAELQWLLTSVTAYGELQRMHQFKEKSDQQREFVSTGLLVYPVLQAADILLYRTDEVPVGEDQKQHLELTRDIAQRFNSRYGETFVLPEHRIPEVAARVMDLQVPTAKMSTTGGTELGTVLVLDDADTIRRKFRSAVTDSGREIVGGPGKEGISNLIEILAAVRGVDPEEVEKEYADASGYAAFKQDVGDAVVGLLAPVRERYEQLRPDEAAITETLATGAEKARTIASETLAAVRGRMGFPDRHDRGRPAGGAG